MNSPVLQRVLLTVTALGMVISTVLVPFDGSAPGPGKAVTPPGLFFAIWGLVIVLCLAVAALSWRRYGTAAVAAVGWPLIIAQAGFSVWLLVAASTSGPATVVVFAGILVALLVALNRLRGLSGKGRAGLVAAAVGVYAGWSSAAIWLNVVTTSPARFGDSPMFQALCLFGAALTAAAVLWRLRPSLGYALAVGWAFLGVAVAAFNAHAWLPLAVALIGLAGVAVLAIATRPTASPAERVATRVD